MLVIDAEMMDYTLLRSAALRAIGPLAIEFESKTMTLQQGSAGRPILTPFPYSRLPPTCTSRTRPYSPRLRLILAH